MHDWNVIIYYRKVIALQPTNILTKFNRAVSTGLYCLIHTNWKTIYLCICFRYIWNNQIIHSVNSFEPLPLLMKTRDIWGAVRFDLYHEKVTRHPGMLHCNTIVFWDGEFSTRTTNTSCQFDGSRPFSIWTAFSIVAPYKGTDINLECCLDTQNAQTKRSLCWYCVDWFWLSAQFICLH